MFRAVLYNYLSIVIKLQETCFSSTNQIDQQEIKSTFQSPLTVQVKHQQQTRRTCTLIMATLEAKQVNNKRHLYYSHLFSLSLQVTLRSKPDVQFKKPITRPHTRQYLKNISNSQTTSDNTTSVKHDQITKDKVLTIGQQHREPTRVAEPEDNGLKQEESPMEVADIAQSFSQKLIISAEVDEEERHNPLTCYDYIHDIYRYLKEIEVSQHYTH